MVSFDIVRQLALSFPGVEENLSWDMPAFKVGKRIFVCLRQDGNSLVVKASDMDIAALPMFNPDTFSVPEHYVGYGVIIVQMDTVDPEELEGLIIEAWRRMAPKRLLAQYEETV